MFFSPPKIVFLTFGADFFDTVFMLSRAILLRGTDSGIEDFVPQYLTTLSRGIKKVAYLDE